MSDHTCLAPATALATVSRSHNARTDLATTEEPEPKDFSPVRTHAFPAVTREATA